MATILVVDDRATNRELVVTLLRHKGHRAIEAADGAEGLRLARADRPDLVISDILMPTMDGFELVRRLRADPDLGATKVIFYTAHYHGREARALAQACGVSRVLIRPCKPGVMLQAIDEELGAASASPAPAPAVEIDRDLLRLMTDMLSHKVDELTAANQRLAALTDVNLQLASERDPQRLLQSVCRDARHLGAARYAVLCLRDKTADRPAFSTSSGYDADMLKGLAAPRIDHPVFAPVLAQRRNLRFDNAGGDPESAGLPPGYPRVTSVLAVPIASLERTYGWICLADKVGGRGFDAEDERVVASLAAQVGRIYENGSLYSEMKESAEKLSESERRLRQSEAGLARAQEVARLAHVITRGDGSFESWSATLPGLVGTDADSVPRSTRAWLKIIHPNDREAFRAKSIEAGVRMERTLVEYRIIRGDGERHVSHVMEPLDDLAGSDGRARWFTTLQDITPRKQAEQEVRRLNASLERRVAERTTELEAANKELEAFDYSISHDLRAPLTRMEGFAAILAEQHGAKLDPRARDLLQRIGNSVADMSQLVEDLFALSTAVRGEPVRSQVDATALATAIVAGLRKSDPAREVRFEAAPGMTVRADPGLLRAVLANLLGNAWKFTRNRVDALIEMGSLEREGERVFFVRDNGAGFDGADAGKLFIPFQRLHSRAAFEGTGIGLATVQRIVRRHGGRVWAEGQVDRGAAFFFSLPA